MRHRVVRLDGERPECQAQSPIADYTCGKPADWLLIREDTSEYDESDGNWWSFTTAICNWHTAEASEEREEVTRYVMMEEPKVLFAGKVDPDTGETIDVTPAR